MYVRSRRQSRMYYHLGISGDGTERRRKGGERVLARDSSCRVLRVLWVLVGTIRRLQHVRMLAREVWKLRMLRAL
jgi:hypothetical protein